MLEKKILIVEDEEGIALHIQFMLKRLGYIPLGPVARGDEAVQQAGELRPDLVLMDVNLLDGMTGIAAATQILDRFAIPVIYLSAVANEEVLQAARGSNPYAYIIKPVQQIELHAAIDLALYKHDMEQRLYHSEARYRRLFDTMTSGFMLFDVLTDANNQAVDYRVVEVNPTYLNIIGASREQLIGSCLSQFISPAVLCEYLKLYQETLQSGTSAHLEYFYAQRNLTLEMRAYQPDAGQMAVIVNDITERRKAEQAVAESELRFRQMAETVNEVFWLRSSENGQMLYVNPAYQRIWGRSLDDLYSNANTFFDGIHPDDLPRVKQARQNQVQNGASFDEEYRIVRPDGSQRWVWVRAFPVREADGQLVRYSGIAEDITERKRFEQELLQSYHRTEQALRRMTVLRNIDLAITTHTELQTMVGTVLDYIIQLNEVDAALIFYPDQTPLADGGLRLAGIAGLPHELLADPVLGAMRQEAERVFTAGQTIVASKLNTLTGPVLVSMGRATADPLGFASYCFLPLITKGQVNGVLLLLRRCSDDDSPELQYFFQSLAMQVAIAIDNVDLFQGLKRSNTELRQAYDETIKGWAQALELRSADTRGHCDRVVELSEVLARALGMSEEQLVHFRRGVMLHDIGKLGIPDSILLKEGSLTPEEWAAIHLHPVYGYEMLRDIAYLRPAVNVPYCHHEQWDGNGYPRGLAGTDIPREARIFAVVDAWDALISERPYHAPWPPCEAVEYLINQSGKQFDPEVVEAFLGII